MIKVIPNYNFMPLHNIWCNLYITGYKQSNYLIEKFMWNILPIFRGSYMTDHSRFREYFLASVLNFSFKSRLDSSPCKESFEGNPPSWMLVRWVQMKELTKVKKTIKFSWIIYIYIYMVNIFLGHNEDNFFLFLPELSLTYAVNIFKRRFIIKKASYLWTMCI